MRFMAARKTLDIRYLIHIIFTNIEKYGAFEFSDCGTPVLAQLDKLVPVGGNLDNAFGARFLHRRFSSQNACKLEGRVVPRLLLCI